MRARRRSQGWPDALRQSERLVEERDRRRDAREPVAAAAEAEEHVGPIDVREAPGARRARARAWSDLDRVAGAGRLLERPALARERPHLELGRAERGQLAACLTEELDRLGVAVGLGKRLGAGEQRLDARAVVGGDPVEQELRVDGQPLRQPGDRLVGRARLPALDLADVLLREAVAGQRGLRQAGGDAQRADAFADARGTSRGSGGTRDGRIAHTVCTQPAASPGPRPPMG